MCRRIRSCSEAEAKKYSWPQAQASWPAGLSRGIENARDAFGAAALVDRADMVAGVERVETDRVDRLALHRRSVFTVSPRQPTTGVS